MKYIFYLLLALITSQTLWAKENPIIEIGDTPYPKLGVSTKGESINLENMQGKVVIVTFWATWCSYCIKEMNVLETIQKKVDPDRLQIIAVNFKESKKQYNRIKRQLKNFNITLTHDTKGLISKRYGVTSLPHLFMINKNGQIAHIHHGYSDKQLPKIIDEINGLLVE